MSRFLIISSQTFSREFMSLQGFLLHQKTTRNSYLESKDGPARPASNMDRFERCFSIFKLTEEATRATETPTDADVQSLNTSDPSSRPASQLHGDEHSQRVRKAWRAVRVDLVVSPISQFAFALLGWTGSKVSSHQSARAVQPAATKTHSDSTFSTAV